MEANSEAADLFYFCNIFYSYKRENEALQSLKKLIEINPVLDNQGRAMFQVIYKNIIDSIRSSLGNYSNYYQYEVQHQHTEQADILFRKKEQLCEKLIPICNEAIEIIDQQLLPNSPDQQTTVYYLKFKGDLYRYISEYSDETESDNAIKQAESAYDQAFSASEGNLPPYDSTYLSLVLNAAVFKYQIQKRPTEAIDMLNNALDRTNEIPTDSIHPDQNEDIQEVIRLMRTNLAIWNEEAKESVPEQ